MAFEIFDDRFSLGLIVLMGDEEGGDKFEVQSVPEQTWTNGVPENYISEIHFYRTRESFKAAYRVARLLSNARPRLVAVIPPEDVHACRKITVSPFHAKCVDVNRRVA